MTAALTIPSSLVVASGKGGVGKTALSTTLAGLWALRGRRVVLVDTDVQASATITLGLDPIECGNGRCLLDSVMHGDRLQTVASPDRPGLSVVTAGRATAHLAKYLVTQPNGAEQFAAPFLSGASNWDTIIFDVPPAGGSAHIPTIALSVGRYLIAPTTDHPHDLEGLRVLGDDLEEIGSPIVLLGVVLYKVGAASTAGRARALGEIGDILGAADSLAAPFNTIVRAAPAAYSAALEKGLLVHEFAEWAKAVENGMSAGERISLAKQGKLPPLPANLPAFSAEFTALADEIEHRILVAEKQLAA